MAEAGDGSGHTPLTLEWTPAPRASHYPWQGDRPAAAPSLHLVLIRKARAAASSERLQHPQRFSLLSLCYYPTDHHGGEI